MRSVTPEARVITKTAAAYFGIVFGVGFVLGSVRVPFLVPRLGERWAELAEMPVMFIAIVLTAGYLVKKCGGAVTSGGWTVAGCMALGFLVAAELLLAVVLDGRGVGEYIASRDPVSGSAYLAMLIVFAAMPWLLHRLRAAQVSGQA